jgi:acyl-ACP thioesterase
MDAIYTTSLLLPPNDIDFANRLKPSALFTYIQSTASAHAERLHLGYTAMQSAGLFWVLSWVKVELTDFPRYQDTITITTWPHRRYRLFSIRDFLFAGPAGQVFCRARSAWLPVDAASLRVASLDKLPRPVPYQETHSALDDLPARLPNPAQAETLYEKLVGYTDLDLNQHVNNAKYVEYLLDGYPQDFHRRHRLQALTISFQAECKFGDRLALAREVDPAAPLRHYHAARHNGGEKAAFLAATDWMIAG